MVALKKIIVILLKITAILLIMAGCSLSDKKGEKLPFTTIMKGDMYKHYEDGREFPKQNRIFTFQDEWERFLATIDASFNGFSDFFEEVEIDFENFQIIAVIDNVNIHVKFIEIECITEYFDRIEVKVKKPYNGIAAAQCMSQPYHIVSTSKSTKQFEFKYVK